MKRIWLVLLFLGILGGSAPRWARASIIEEGTGFIHGEHHLFTLTAPPGWVLDNESALSQGMVVVFYPKGESWGSARACSYTRSSPIDAATREPEDVVKRTVNDFRGHGSPNYRARRAKDIRAASGATARVWHYEGDQWGNFEAGAYFAGKKRINAVILTTRSRADFERARPAWEKLVQSYRLLSEEKDTAPLLREAAKRAPLKEDPTFSLQPFDEVAKFAHDLGETEEGKRFESAAARALGEKVARACSQCLRAENAGRAVRLVLIFDAAGQVAAYRAAKDDDAAACIGDKLRGVPAVKPPRNGWMMLWRLTLQDGGSGS